MHYVNAKKHKDYGERWDIIERLEMVNLADVIQDTGIVYHKDCYGTFTSSMHLMMMIMYIYKAPNPVNCSEALYIQTHEHQYLI